MYCQWRFRGLDPVVCWRGSAEGVVYDEDGLPEPWPGRADAFLTACALVAGRREKDLLTMVEALASGGEESSAGAKAQNPARG